jgi:hypothetical protein
MCVTKSFASFDDTQRTALLESLKDLDSFLNENKKNIISYLRASQNIRLEPVFPAEIYLNVNSKTKTTPAMAELIYDFTVLKIWEIMSVYFLSSDDQEIKHEGLEILVGIEQKVHKQIIHNKALNFLHGAFHSAQLGYMPLEIKLFLNKIFEEDEN